MDIKWTENEEKLVDIWWERYKDGSCTALSLRNMFRGRSMAAIHKKYWSRNGKKHIERNEIDQLRFEFAEQKLEHQNS